jgi:tetratricopeptide (TPR) repeat protein
VAGRLARLDYEDGHRARALAALEGVLAREPNHAPTLLLKAQWLASDGQWEAARQQALSAVNADPRSPAARYLLGLAQAETGREAQAIVSFNEVLTLDPFMARAQVQLSRLQLARGEADSALQLARDALRNDAGSRDARLALARSLLAGRRLPAARMEVRAMLASHPDDVDAHVLDGILRLEEDDLAGARAALLRAIELDARHPEAALGLAMVHLRQGDLARARARLDTRMHGETVRPAWLVLAARVHAAAGDLVEAEAALRQAITIDDVHLEAYRMLGDVYAAQGRLDAAVAELDAAGRSAPGVAERTMAALIRHAQGHVADATRRYRDILTRDPDAAVAGNNLAALYAAEGEQLDLAVELATRASERLALAPDAWDTLGWAYYRKRLPAMAIRHFERAVEQAPDTPAYRHRLGLALAAHGDVTRARAAFEAALSLDPGFGDARRALADLQRASRP